MELPAQVPGLVSVNLGWRQMLELNECENDHNENPHHHIMTLNLLNVHSFHLASFNILPLTQNPWVLPLEFYSWGSARKLKSLALVPISTFLALAKRCFLGMRYREMFCPDCFGCKLRSHMVFFGRGRQLVV